MNIFYLIITTLITNSDTNISKFQWCNSQNNFNNIAVWTFECLYVIRKRYIKFLIFRNLKLTQKNKIMHLHYKIYSIQRVLSHCLLIREERFFSLLWSLISVNCVIRTSELIIVRMRNYYIVEPYPIRDSYIFINGGQISENLQK